MNKVRQAVIFAGGRGERLRPITDDLPKPMAPVKGVPFTDYLLKMLVDAGIEKILFLVGYRADKVIGYYGDRLSGGIPVEYSVGTAEDLTGRRLLNAHAKLDPHFLLLYGDNFWPAPLNEMIANYERVGFPVTTTVFGNKDGTGEYGVENNVAVAPGGKVKSYDKSRKASGLNGVDIGFFIVDKNVLDVSEMENISFEERVVSRLASEGRLGAFLTNEQYYFITTLGDLRHFETIVVQKGLPKLERKGKA